MDKISEALEVIKESYTKVLMVNLSTREFTTVTLPDYEDPTIIDTFKTIDDYVNWYVNNGRVHTDDVWKFTQFFTPSSNMSTVTYRRLVSIKDTLMPRPVYMYMSLLPTKYYTDDNKECILYVKDINDLYLRESMEVERRAKRYDGMTGLLNRSAFEQDILNLSGNVGVAFIDLNGLKYTNDTLGHEQGDTLILNAVRMLKQQFPAYSIYRTGGDEFIIIANNVKLRVFIHTVVTFHKSLWNCDTAPIMSVGYSCDPAEDIKEIISDAEKQMYEDKAIFYTKYPKYNMREATEKNDE